MSTLKELCKRWEPAVHKGFVKRQLHTALADILESVEELRYYRTHFIRQSSAAPVAPDASAARAGGAAPAWVNRAAFGRLPPRRRPAVLAAPVHRASARGPYRVMPPRPAPCSPASFPSSRRSS